MREIIEWRKCKRAPAYFINHYCHLLDPTEGDWVPFRLWPAQHRLLDGWHAHQYNLTLKARQLGVSWLGLAYGLWGIVFHPHYEMMIVSRRETEAIYLAGPERLRGMYARLPSWMRAARITRDNVNHWRLSTGSGARAFPSDNVDSYTANLMLIDEADHPAIDLRVLLNSAKPTIDAGGKLLLVSRAYKATPASHFKQLYRVGVAGDNAYHVAFLPWDAHPARSQGWYAAQKADALANEGTLDSLYEQYPATDEQALAPRTLDKRIPPAFLSACYHPTPPLTVRGAPALPGLTIYRTPEPGAAYVIGADPAEGNPTSDASAATVLHAGTGEEVASLAGRYEVDTFGAYLRELATYYRGASVLVERNNHGHAVLLWLRDQARSVRVLRGPDHKPGWLTTRAAKAELYAEVTAAFRDGETIIHNFETLTQLQRIDGSTLRAPPGGHDDRAIAYGLALLARGRRLPDVRRVVAAGGLYGRPG